MLEASEDFVAEPATQRPDSFDARVSAVAGPYKICGARSTFTTGGAGTRVDRCAISPDGSRIAMLVGDGNTIEIWTLEGTGR